MALPKLSPEQWKWAAIGILGCLTLIFAYFAFENKPAQTVVWQQAPSMREEGGVPTWRNPAQVVAKPKELPQVLKNGIHGLRGTPQTVIKLVPQIVYRYLTAPNALTHADSTHYDLAWHYGSEDGYLQMAAHSAFSVKDTLVSDSAGIRHVTEVSPGITTVDSVKMRADLIVGIRENKRVLEVFARSANPHVTIGGLEGAIIQKKRKRIAVTVGPQMGIGSDPINGGVFPYVGVGVGVGIKLFEW